ncbi:MAG: protein-L-isoaspartate O-methyltransferase [Rhodospirillaceae bacterium]|nr:protein-L-isoaspartate O-methyltransferase [Rhodospirillaceae bacterium]HAA92374.1 protein-L-isoaspartate O-methyltransferase [Rhodospirillaceae bacterium]|tara:strand:+ start:1492 stop:2115 length:624 start_codon:yes stop_codon:yes gene_type:complete
MTLRQAGVTDPEILAAFELVPRDAFVPDTFRDRSYDETALPIGLGQTISDPNVVARMVAALGVGKRLKVLEIGTGSGFQTAILSQLFRRVYTIERHAPLLAEAEARLNAMKRFNITAQAGDGNEGWPAQAPFDRIIVAAAAPEVPAALADQLAVGGVMVAPVGPEHGSQKVLRLERTENGIETTELFDVRFLPLVEGLPDEEAMFAG